MEIKPQDIKDFIHLYIGCEVYIQRLDKYGRLIMVSSESSGRGYVRITSPDITGWYEVKLILRPLSDMTEEEGEECGRRGSMGWRLINPPEKSPQNLHKGVVHRQSAEVLYLCSIGIDLFGLIPAGLAIDKTSLI